MAFRSLLTVGLLGLFLTACSKQAEQAPVVAVEPAASASSVAPVAAAPGAPSVTLPGTRADYIITQSGDAYSLAHKSGKDVAVSVKAQDRVRFSDISMTFDTKGNPGAAYRLFYAAFNRAPDHAGMGYWLKALDAGTSLEAVAGMLANSTEFAGLYAPTISDEALVRAFFKNVLRKDGDAAEIAQYQAKLSSKELTRAKVLAEISSSEAAQKADQLGLEKGILYKEDGVTYAPFASANVDPIIVAAAPAK